MRTLLLIARHGNTFSPGEVVTRVGKTDLPLVESGVLQARKLGAYLKQNNLIPDVIFTSELQRTQKTAEEILKVLELKRPIKTLAIFNEIDYGPDENQPEDKVISRVGVEVLNAWESSAIVPPGWKLDPKTIIQAWQDFSADLLDEFSGKKILVVTSNGIARFSPYITGDFSGFSKTHPIKISTGALCIFENSLPEKIWTCLKWNIKP